jgi:uncharacterized membrane protein YvbJ
MTEMVPCPFCGEQINKNAKACRYCGSDEETGWSDNEYSDSLGPDDGFDYDELAEQEFGEVDKKGKSKGNKHVFARVTGAVLLIIAVLFFLKSLF